MVDPVELIDVVNDKDEVVQSLPREQVHAQMLTHRTSLVWVTNSKGQVLCQQRSHLKDRWSGMWECWFGGHLLAGTSYIDTAATETKEELGIEVNPKNFMLFDKRQTQTSQENLFFSVYALKEDLDINTIEYEVEEVELLQWFSISELRVIYESDDSKWVKYGYELEMLDWLESRF